MSLFEIIFRDLPQRPDLDLAVHACSTIFVVDRTSISLPFEISPCRLPRAAIPNIPPHATNITRLAASELYLPFVQYRIVLSCGMPHAACTTVMYDHVGRNGQTNHLSEASFIEGCNPICLGHGKPQVQCNSKENYNTN